MKAFKLTLLLGAILSFASCNYQEAPSSPGYAVSAEPEVGSLRFTVHGGLPCRGAVDFSGRQTDLADRAYSFAGRVRLCKADGACERQDFTTDGTAKGLHMNMPYYAFEFYLTPLYEEEGRIVSGTAFAIKPNNGIMTLKFEPARVYAGYRIRIFSTNDYGWRFPGGAHFDRIFEATCDQESIFAKP